MKPLEILTNSWVLSVLLIITLSLVRQVITVKIVMLHKILFKNLKKHHWNEDFVNNKLVPKSYTDIIKNKYTLLYLGSKLFVILLSFYVDWPSYTEFIIGAIVFLEIFGLDTVIQTLFIYKNAPDQIKDMNFSKKFSLQLSSVRILSIASILLLLFVLTLQPFILGGTATYLLFAVTYFRKSRKATSTIS